MNNGYEPSNLPNKCEKEAGQHRPGDAFKSDRLVAKYLNLQKPSDNIIDRTDKVRVTGVTYSVKKKSVISRVDQDNSDISFDAVQRPGARMIAPRPTNPQRFAEDRVKLSVNHPIVQLGSHNEYETRSIYSDTDRFQPISTRYINSSGIELRNAQLGKDKTMNRAINGANQYSLCNKEFNNLYNPEQLINKPSRANFTVDPRNITPQQPRPGIDKEKQRSPNIYASMKPVLNLRATVDKLDGRNTDLRGSATGFSYKYMREDDNCWSHTYSQVQESTFRNNGTKNMGLSNPRAQHQLFTDVSPLRNRTNFAVLEGDRSFDHPYDNEDEPVLDMLNNKQAPVDHDKAREHNGSLSVPKRLERDKEADPEAEYLDESQYSREKLANGLISNRTNQNIESRVRNLEHIHSFTHKSVFTNSEIGIQVENEQTLNHIDNRTQTPQDCPTCALCTPNGNSDKLTINSSSQQALLTQKFLLAAETERLIFMALQMYSRFA